MFDVSSIIGFFKKNFKRKDLLLGILILGGFFATRLINLERFPIFTDEGIYIRWAKVAWQDASWRFISLTDGRQPLQTWGTIPFLKLFPDNPLLAGRLFSVATGFAGLLGVFTLLFYLFGKRAAFWGAFFYIFTPFFIFYDRMALVDSGVNAAFVWILFFSILLVKTLRLDYALIFGLVSGMSLLAKSSIRLFIGLSALAPILVWDNKLKSFLRRVLNFSVLYLIVVFLSILIYNIQRLSPYLHFVEIKNKTFILGFDEFLKNPFALLPHNLLEIPRYIVSETSFALPIFAIIGLYLLFRKNLKLALYIVLWTVLPYIAIAAFARVLFPRYLIFFATIFLVLSALLFANIKNRKVLILSIIFYILSVGYYDFAILADYKKIPFPEIDRGQYIEGTSAGYGVKEIVDFSREKAKEKPVILLAEGNFGVVGDMLSASLAQSDKNISIKGYWPLEEKSLIENQNLLDKNSVYVVFSHRKEFPKEWSIKFIRKYDKGQSAFFLFELTK